MQRSVLTGMPLDRVRASVATLDSLYLREVRRLGYVAPSAGYTEKPEEVLGGYVMQSKPGLYRYVIVCDFKSLYPSIIRTFNIDPVTLVPGCRKKESDAKTVVAPNGACFDGTKEAILPRIITRLWHQRDLAKAAHNMTASYAIKIHMNSIYGVLGNPNCRFYSFPMANAITHFGQSLIRRAGDIVRKKGYEVIYGDTDSIFIDLAVDSYDDAAKAGVGIQEMVNRELTAYIKDTYHRKNNLELEFEKVYERFLMPYARSKEAGAKKRYAGLLVKRKGGKLEKDIDITGLEFVRRDWTELSRVFQYALLEKVFSDEDPGDYIRQFAKDLKEGRHDGLLVYRKAIRKSADAYTKTTPPHVKAARIFLDKAGKLDSNVIAYVVTTAGPEPVEYRTHPYDYQHYLEKQLKPIADAILVFFGRTFDGLVEGKAQSSLFDF